MEHRISIPIAMFLCTLALVVTGCASRQMVKSGRGAAKVAEFHRRVGEGLETLYADQIEGHYEALAYHYIRSDNQQKAIHYLVQMAHQSKEKYAHEQAIEYYNQALTLMHKTQGATPSLRGNIHMGLTEIYWRLADYENALDSARKTLEFSADREQRARSYRIMGSVYERLWKLDLAIQHQNLAMAELEDDRQSSETASIYSWLFWPTIYQGHTEEAINMAQQGLNIAKEAGDYSVMVQLYICLTWANMEPRYGISDMDKGFGYAQKSMDAARKAGDLHSIGGSTFWLGWAHMRRGEDDTAIELMTEALEIFRKIGYRFEIRQLYNWLSGIYISKRNLQGLMDMIPSLLEY